MWVAEKHQQDYSDMPNQNAGQDHQETRCEQNSEAHQIARLDPERRQEEQIRNTATCQQLCLEILERRQEEQARNTATHR